MPNYRATNLDTQVVVEYDEAVPRAEHLVAPWRVERMEIALAPPDVPQEPPPVYGGQRLLSVRDFMRLFTPAERITIRQASASSAALGDFMDMMYAGDDVNLDSPETVAGVTMLEQAGIIAAGRAQEVLRG